MSDNRTGSIEKAIESPQPALDPSGIMQVGMGFWASKTLLTAVKAGVFTIIAESESLSGKEIQAKLGWHDRGVYDLLDTLVALKFLTKEGLKETAVYSNTPETDFFLDKNKQAYIGGILEMANDRLYKFWADLDEAMVTGKAQNEIKHTGKSMFESVYAEPERLKLFVNGMTGISRGNFTAFAQKFDFSKYKTMCDMGGAVGLLSCLVAEHNPHMQCTSFDLPKVEPIAQEFIKENNMEGKVETMAGDFFNNEFPKADVITMGMILHDWNLEDKKKLIKKAYNALPEGGAFVAIENIIDDERQENAFGLMMSLNMLIEFGDAFDFTGADFDSWIKEAGFKSSEKIHLAGPCSAVIAYK